MNLIKSRHILIICYFLVYYFMILEHILRPFPKRAKIFREKILMKFNKIFIHSIRKSTNC
jgi:hypothetical protein